MLTAKDGLRIATKLGLTPEEKRKHTRVAVVIKGQYIGSYGISRSSKELQHDYIASQVGLTGREARDLSNCPLSAEEYELKLRERGKLTVPRLNQG
jgi:hypothetical protein